MENFDDVDPDDVAIYQVVLFFSAMVTDESHFCKPGMMTTQYVSGLYESKIDARRDFFKWFNKESVLNDIMKSRRGFANRPNKDYKFADTSYWGLEMFQREFDNFWKDPWVSSKYSPKYKLELIEHKVTILDKDRAKIKKAVDQGRCVIS